MIKLSPFGSTTILSHYIPAPDLGTMGKPMRWLNTLIVGLVETMLRHSLSALLVCAKTITFAFIWPFIGFWAAWAGGRSARSISGGHGIRRARNLID
jgi:hypothetical protein